MGVERKRFEESLLRLKHTPKRDFFLSPSSQSPEMQDYNEWF